MSDQTLTPYISVADGAEALAWYADALGATEHVRYVGDDGRIGHAEFAVAGATVMLSSAYPEMRVVAPDPERGWSVALYLEVDDCDGLHERAIAHGATSLMDPTDKPDGGRRSTLVDPFGHRWMFNQQIGDVVHSDVDGFEVVEPETQA